MTIVPSDRRRPMHEDFTIPFDYVRPIAELLRGRGADVDEWLRRSAIADEPEHLLSYTAFRRLVLNAIDAAREPALGLFVGERLVAATHGMVGFAAVNARTVREALDVVEQFSRLRTSLIAISHETTARELRLVFTEALPLGDIERPLLEAVILSIKNVLDEITMGACPARRVAFPFEAPEYAALARDILGCDVRYDQGWAGLTASLEILDVPIKLADRAAFEEASLICRRELDRLASSESLSTRVRHLLLEKQTGFPSLQVTARVLHMTSRTLHRRLVAEGTSYRALLESVRRTLAVEHLRTGRLGIDEIAFRLGYTDLANFRRAFKRWESVPPSEYRSRHAARGAKG